MGLLTFCLSFKGVRDSLCLIVCWQAKANVCPDSYRDVESEIQLFLCGGVFYFFLGLLNCHQVKAVRKVRSGCQRSVVLVVLSKVVVS